MDVVSLDDTTEAVPGVDLVQLASGDRMSVQHFRFEPGAVVEPHDHPHEQVGFVYRGALTLVAEGGGTTVVERGDSYVISGGEIHGAENRGDEPVEGVDVFGPPREHPPWAD